MIVLYILWALLNISVTIAFLVICFKATKLVRERIGLLAACIFVIGLLSFNSGKKKVDKNTDPATNNIKQWTFSSWERMLQRNKSSVLVNLDKGKTTLASHNLRIMYGIDSSGRKLPVSAYADVNGFVSGTEWWLAAVTVNTSGRSDEFAYQLLSIEEWKFLGMTIYLGTKEYTGTVQVP